MDVDRSSGGNSLPSLVVVAVSGGGGVLAGSSDGSCNCSS